jgi:hypothetical protein
MRKERERERENRRKMKNSIFFGVDIGNIGRI